MKEEYLILRILVGTFCLSILIGMVGVAFKIVDAQFVEGLITGGLMTLITMLFKDILNQNGGKNVQSNSTISTKPIQEPGS